MNTILIVDDDVYIGDMLEEILTKEGYQTARAYSGTEALMYLSSARPDLILLDLMLPGLPGEELLPLTRGIPVIVVSAKAETSDKVDLLLGGACDYVTLDTVSHTVNAADTPVRLTQTEYAILKLLMQNPSQVITKSLLLDRISEDTPDCTESSLKVHISNLRKKLKAVDGNDYIEAVWGIGFKLNEEIC